MIKFDWRIKFAKVINFSCQLYKNRQPGVGILILNLQTSSKKTNFPFEKVLCNNIMKTDGYNSHKNNTNTKLQTALLGHQFISGSEGRALFSESPLLPVCCQVFLSKHLIVLGTSSWQSLLERYDLTLWRTKFFASIILLISGEARQQRIQMKIHNVVMELNNCSVVTMVTWEETEQELRKSNSEITILPISNNLPRTLAFLNCLLGAQDSKILKYNVTFSVTLIFTVSC